VRLALILWWHCVKIEIESGGAVEVLSAIQERFELYIRIEGCL